MIDKIKTKVLASARAKKFPVSEHKASEQVLTVRFGVPLGRVRALLRKTEDVHYVVVRVIEAGVLREYRYTLAAFLRRFSKLLSARSAGLRFEPTLNATARVPLSRTRRTYLIKGATRNGFSGIPTRTVSRKNTAKKKAATTKKVAKKKATKKAAPTEKAAKKKAAMMPPTGAAPRKKLPKVAVKKAATTKKVAKKKATKKAAPTEKAAKKKAVMMPPMGVAPGKKVPKVAKKEATPGKPAQRKKCVPAAGAGLDLWWSLDQCDRDDQQQQQQQQQMVQQADDAMFFDAKDEMAAPDHENKEGETSAPVVDILFPNVAVDDEHPVSGATINVDVSLKPEPVAGVVGDVAIPHAAPELVYTLQVHLLCGPVSRWERLTYSGGNGTIEKAHFELTVPTLDASERSLLALRVNFYLNCRWCGEGLRNLDLRRDASVAELDKIPLPKTLEWRQAINFEPGAQPPDLIVRIQRASAPREYQWSCLSPHLSFSPPACARDAIMTLQDDAETFVRNLFKPLAAMTLARTDVADVEGAGETIYGSTPKFFKDCYWALWSSAKDSGFPFETVQFVTDEPYIPWELMRLTDPTRAPEVATEFLAIRHAVGRWLALESAHLTQQIHVKSIAVAASDYASVSSVAQKLPWAAQERAFLVSDYQARPITLNSTDVLDLLEHGSEQAVHFACHGKMSITNPLGSELTLEDPPKVLKPTMIARDEVRRGLGREHPLVFLNACEAGGSAASLSLVAGFPAAFLSAGASAVICPLWAVSDERAKKIAKDFYLEVLRTSPPRALGDVLREIRRRWRAEKHMTFMAYVLYGDPLALVAH
ncbi:MAG: CHAT domain-containing protein [Deltaproteobacteria bacterium]|nr:CHAT domain-containing protein [Deltaproteobacteria bacterium]